MPNLYNPRAYPPNTRRCYWDAEYIASQPFCITSKLTIEEAQQMAEYEESCFWQNLNILQNQLENGEALDGGECEASPVNASIVPPVSEYLAAIKTVDFDTEVGLDSITSKLTPQLRSKTTKNRSFYLTR